MKKYGLIGYPLSHSFSKKYFTEKFLRENIPQSLYELYPLEDIEMISSLLTSEPLLVGLNVTIPYKEKVIPNKFITAQKVGEFDMTPKVQLVSYYKHISYFWPFNTVSSNKFEIKITGLSKEAKYEMRYDCLGQG